MMFEQRRIPKLELHFGFVLKFWAQKVCLLAWNDLWHRSPLMWLSKRKIRNSSNAEALILHRRDEAVIQFDKKLRIKLNRSFGIHFELVDIVSLAKSTTCYLKCHQLSELLLIFSSCYIVRSRHTGLQKVSDSIYTKVLGRQLIVSMFSLLTDLDSKDSKCWKISGKEEEIF